jgi:hypothetical protein
MLLGAGEERSRWGDCRSVKLEVPVQRVYFYSESEGQPQLRHRSDDVSVRGAIETEVGTLHSADKIVQRYARPHSRSERLGKSGNAARYQQEP